MMRTNETSGKITKSAYEELILICSKALPMEACGVLARSENEDAATIIFPIKNVHNSPSNSFSFDPKEWTTAFFEMQKKGQTLVGIYHSHPHSAPFPSLRDYSGFLPSSELTYWIVSLENSLAPNVQPYTKSNGYFKAVSLVLT
ncbi:M67 family metallopeptidase [Paenibacillus sp. GSMTC-2017]|uniref:Mov34/MPN/PAD-1 family protein n=1 Tax=Paenibacillus sp. GSMTC-2017 TaxID=2794350 RepID=UPI0018D70AD4|nr:M67 family metallopeptidase [Paenibacillus sp. GSMTC-2017]MBH5318194.1 M67 family metallopeptidase [Paenibacillus sp. GSMTC-2017]